MSVYRRGGIYWYDFLFRGRRIRESTGLPNKTGALRAEAIRKAELAEGRAGILRRERPPEFEGFVNTEFLPWCKNEHARHPRTHRRYVVSSKPLVRFFRKLPLDAISSGHVEKFKLARTKEASAAGTNRDLAALRYMLNFAVRQGYIARNPVTMVRFLPEGPGSTRIISHVEEHEYLEAANPLLRDVARSILETGMRPEEVFNIRKEDVHLERRYLRVPTGKTKFARRDIPLTEPASEVLKRRLAAARGAYLFPHRSDPEKPLTDIHKAHGNALRDSKIKLPFRIYDLRHTFGSRSAMAGMDLGTLRELMGHSTIAITMRYVHPTPEHKREAMRRLEVFNVERTCAAYEHAHPPQKSPQLV